MSSSIPAASAAPTEPLSRRGPGRVVACGWSDIEGAWPGAVPTGEEAWGLPRALTTVSDGRFELRFVEPMRVEFWPDTDLYQCRVEYLHPSLTGQGRLPVDALRDFERNVVFHFRRLYHASPSVEGDDAGVPMWERLRYAVDVAHYERTYQRLTETVIGTVTRNEARGVEFGWDDADVGRTFWPSEDTSAVADLPTFRVGESVKVRFYLDADDGPAELLSVNAYTRPTEQDRQRVRDAIRNAPGPQPEVGGL